MSMYVCVKTLILSAILFVAGPAVAQNVHGDLKVVKGDVQIKSSKSGQTTRARIGEKVYPKDVVITGKDSRAKIVMIDKNEINISPESQVEIQNYEFDPKAGKKDVLLNVIYGKVRSKVEQKYDGKSSRFQIKTPAAVAGVRGTDFMTSFNRGNQTTQVVTFSGQVEFGLPGPKGTILNPVMVNPGSFASQVMGQMPTPPAPVENIKQLDQETQADAGPAPAPAAAAPPPRSTASSSPPPPPRPMAGPAATPGSGGSGMFRPEDFAGNNTPPPAFAPPIPVGLPQTPPINNMPNCDFCTRVIENSNNKLIINVTGGSPSP